MLACPRCRFSADAVADTCPRCGVVFAKVGMASGSRTRRPGPAWTLPRVHLGPNVVAAGVAAAAMAWYLGSLGYAPFHWRPSGGIVEARPVDTSVEPEQVDIPPADRKLQVWRVGRTHIEIDPVAHYRIAGRVVAQDFFYTDYLAVAAPVDLTLAWGAFATHRFDANITYSHFARFGASRARNLAPADIQALGRHLSNNHLIPANDRIRAALASVAVNEDVELEGDLVDVSIAEPGRNRQASTSQTREDTGAGACEIIYVRRVKIGRTAFR